MVGKADYLIAATAASCVRLKACRTGVVTSVVTMAMITSNRKAEFLRCATMPPSHLTVARLGH